MSTPQRVVWSEGMYVSPQHMQQQDAYHEQRTARLVESVAPVSWGVVSLRMDEGALRAGSVALEQCAAVLPGGHYVTFEGSDAQAPRPRAVDPHFPATQRSVDVYLGVAREREGVANVYGGQQTERDDAGARYVRASRAVHELTDAMTPAVSVCFATPNLVVLFGDEVNNDYDSVKVAEITRDSTGAYALVGDFVPPSVCVGASGYLVTQLHDLLAKLLAKRQELMQTTRQRGEANTEFQAADLSSFLQLSAVNGMLPVVRGMLDVPQLSPLQAYLSLGQLAGQLATFDPRCDPVGLPKFVHTDLRSTFSGLFGLITSSLSGSFVSRSLKIALREQGGGVWSGVLQEDAARGCREAILAVSSETPPEQVAAKLPLVAKVCAERDLRLILSSATPGVGMKVTHRPPPEVAVRPGVVYFSLDTTGPHWKSAIEQRSVVVFAPPPFSQGGASLELYVIPAS